MKYVKFISIRSAYRKDIFKKLRIKGQKMIKNIFYHYMDSAESCLDFPKGSVYFYILYSNPQKTEDKMIVQVKLCKHVKKNWPATCKKGHADVFDAPS